MYTHARQQYSGVEHSMRRRSIVVHVLFHLQSLKYNLFKCFGNVVESSPFVFN